MATRSGTVDPGLVLWLARTRGCTPAELSEAWSTARGSSGSAGTADMRAVLDAGGRPASRDARLGARRVRPPAAGRDRRDGGVAGRPRRDRVHRRRRRAVGARPARWPPRGSGSSGSRSTRRRTAVARAGRPTGTSARRARPCAAFVIPAREDVEIARGVREVRAGAIATSPTRASAERAVRPITARRADGGTMNPLIGGSPMRILLAVDGSASSDRAVELVSSFAFPPGRRSASWRSISRTLTALAIDVGAPARARDRPRTRPTSAACARRSPCRGARSAAGVEVEGYLVQGRPGSSIVDEAGAIGRRTWSSSAAGATGSSRPCSWAARRPRSSTTRRARSSWPATAARAARVRRRRLAVGAARGGPCSHAGRSSRASPSRVVTVAEVAVPVAAGFTPASYDQVLESYTRAP